MPDWARPHDIHFDHAAAMAAIDAIDAMRFTLEWAWGGEDRTAVDALATWEGLAADAFRASHRSRAAVTEDISVRLGVLAASIRGAVDDAIVEQARIDALQSEWDAQARIEREIEAAASAEAAPSGSSSPGERNGLAAGVR